MCFRTRTKRRRWRSYLPPRSAGNKRAAAHGGACSELLRPALCVLLCCKFLHALCRIKCVRVPSFLFSLAPKTAAEHCRGHRSHARLIDATAIDSYSCIPRMPPLVHSHG
jgi:hypothetical protein